MDSELTAKQRALEHRTREDTLTREANQLRHAADANHKQHHLVKRHAQTLLAQRTEIERFFLTALEQVKTEIVARRNEQYKTAKLQHSNYLKSLATGKSLAITGPAAPTATGTTGTAGTGTVTGSGRLPSIGSGRDSSGGVGVAPPKPPSSEVDVSDMSLEEKDRVLRLLFAKITNHPLATTAANAAAAGGSTLPPHSFDIHLNTNSSAAGGGGGGAVGTIRTANNKRSTAPASSAGGDASALLMLPPPPDLSSQPTAFDGRSTPAAGGDDRGRTFLTDMKVDGSDYSQPNKSGSAADLSASIAMGSRLLAAAGASSTAAAPSHEAAGPSVTADADFSL